MIFRELFEQWFENLFILNCGRARPILLFSDNHNLRNRVCDPPSPTTRCRCCQSFKGQVQKSCYRSSLSASRFHCRTPQLWRIAVARVCTQKLVRDAFAKCGIHPFDLCAIDRKEVLPRQIPRRSE